MKIKPCITKIWRDNLIPSSLFSMLLAFLFVAPSITNAETIVDGGYRVGAVIDLVSYTKKQASTYTCVSPTQNLSFLERMLASVGIITKTKLLSETDPCANYSGSGGLAFMNIDSSYTLSPYIDLAKREFVGYAGIEKYSRTDKTVSTPRYGSKTCTRTHIYTDYHLSSTGTSGGKVTDSCNTSTPSYSVNYPPYIPVNSAKGSYSATWKYSNTIENFTVTEDSMSQLTFNGYPGKVYNIVINASAQQLVLNKTTNMFEYKNVPCTSITVAGQTLNSVCQTILKATGPAATFNVTPRTSVPYYFYSVSNQLPQAK